MTQESHLLDLRWKVFAESHGMEEYRHGHGLLRGCFRQVDDQRVSVNERPFGVDFVFTAKRRKVPPILWADEDFLKWCRLPVQVSTSEKAYKNAQKLGLVDSAWDDLRMRPHRAAEIALVNADSSASRFRRLAGAGKLTDLGEASVVSALPLNVLIENFGERLSIYLPLTNDPTTSFVTVLKVAGLQAE
jgi:hypothetical protein